MLLLKHSASVIISLTTYHINNIFTVKLVYFCLFQTFFPHDSWSSGRGEHAAKELFLFFSNSRCDFASDCALGFGTS